MRQQGLTRRWMLETFVRDSTGLSRCRCRSIARDRMWLAKAMGVIFVESDGAPGADRACMSIALKQPKTARAAKRAAWPAAVADSREVSHSLGGRSCGEIVGVIVPGPPPGLTPARAAWALSFELDAAGRRRRFGHLPGGAEAGAACGRSGPRRQPPVRPSSRLLAIAPPDRALGATEWMQQGDLERRVWS